MATPTFHSRKSVQRWPRLAAMPRAGWNARPACTAGMKTLKGGNTSHCDRVNGIAEAARRRQTWQRFLVIMVKAPVAGRVKTRLAREVGTVAATGFYRHATDALITRVGRDPRWQTRLAVAPDTTQFARYWGRSVASRPQGGGDLGQRMQRVFHLMPPGPVVIVGSDCPGIAAIDIAQAFRALGTADAVFAPAEDGGYCLVGQHRTPRSLPMFKDVRWSTDSTLADTLANLGSHSVAMLRHMYDVDNADDLTRLKGTAGRRVRPMASG